MVKTSILRLVGSTAPRAEISSIKDTLMELLREGARRMLTSAVEAEVQSYVAAYGQERDAHGLCLVVRNGYMPERILQTGIGPLHIRQPRVNDRRIDDFGRRYRFHSSILPAYLRKTRDLEELIPWLYLRGISTGDFSQALQALIGPAAKGFSANTVLRLCETWQQEFCDWESRSLKEKRYVYFWADGVYFNVRLGDGDRQCVLVVIGVTKDGKKELVAMTDGIRESKISWKILLESLKSRGLEIAPELAVGDGSLGFWSALAEVFPTTKIQRCWVHKTANVLDKLPKSLQEDAKKMLHNIWMAPTRDEAYCMFESFVETFEDKYPKAVDCLCKDKDELLAFYDFPAEHWRHIRTTNPIESSFATVRLRTYRQKGPGSAKAGIAMAFRLMLCAEKRWKVLNGVVRLSEVVQQIKFIDGIRKAA